MTNNFESDNQQAYKLLLRIEIALRELISREYELSLGARWQRQLPGELLKKIRASQTEESRPQFDFVRLGPLYYLTFGELLTLLQQKPAQAVSLRFGGAVFLKQLENLFAPRNAVGHSRPVSSVGLRAVETLYAQMETALTPTHFEVLIAQPDVGLTQENLAFELLPVLANVLQSVGTLPKSFRYSTMVDKAFVQYWWADDTLAGFNRSAIENAIEAISAYNALPTGVGSSGERQKFLVQQHFVKKINHAVAELEKVSQ